MLQYRGTGVPPPQSSRKMETATADIVATGRGFDSTEAEFEAVTERGKAAMASVGGFACIGIKVRKSYVGDVLDKLESKGCIVKWCDEQV